MSDRQDWLEGQAEDQLERERAGLLPRPIQHGPLWDLSWDGDFLVVDLAGGAQLRLREERAVIFANSILVEVEIKRRAVGECPTCGAAYGEMDHAPEPCDG